MTKTSFYCFCGTVSPYLRLLTNCFHSVSVCLQCNAVVVETRRKEEHKKVWLSFLLNSTKSRAYGNSALRLLYKNISIKLGRTKVASDTKAAYFIADWKHWLGDWEHLEPMMQQLYSFLLFCCCCDNKAILKTFKPS